MLISFSDTLPIHMKIFALFLAITFSLPFTTLAAEPSVWTVGSRADVLKGDARGVSIDSNGSITLAPKFAEIYKTEQPYIWATAIDGGGNVYLGTGSDGRIYKVSAAETGAMFADLTELNVTALAIGGSGELFAASSPDGKVYRIDSAGKAKIYFDPKEKYIWALAVDERRQPGGRYGRRREDLSCPIGERDARIVADFRHERNAYHFARRR